MKWLAFLFFFFSLPVYAACTASVSIHSGVNWAGFNVEVAATEDDRAQGLMFRDKLDADAGMLFLYPEAKIRNFWMKNTKIPLDIMFFDEKNKLINIQKSTTPFSEAILPSKAATAIVLEVNAGIFNLLDMDEDKTKLRIQPINSASCPTWVREKYGDTG